MKAVIKKSRQMTDPCISWRGSGNSLQPSRKMLDRSPEFIFIPRHVGGVSTNYIYLVW